jgi:hypothetical protein
MDDPKDIPRWHPSQMMEEATPIVGRLLEKLDEDLDDDERETALILSTVEAWKAGWDSCLTMIVRQADEQGLHLNIDFRTGERADDE